MIKISKLSADLGEFKLRDIDLAIEENQFFVLLGPTGSGKTVLLEAIAGLVPVKKGSITVGNRDITRLTPEKRGVAIVYQDYSLFPHLTVSNNIRYGLHFREMNREKSDSRFDELVEQLNLEKLLDRYPRTLSGGEAQRVSLARALMIEPKILLLDEPLSAIDPSFRGELQTMLKQLHQNSGITFLMVTHDFPEALALAQKAAIISNGTIRQQGDIMDIFRKPCSGFVADFVGMKNIYKARLNDNKAVINGIELELGSKFNKENSYIAIRPEDIILSNKMLSTTSIRNSVKGTVRGIVCNGLSYEVNVSVNSLTFKSIVTNGAMIDLGIEEGKEIYASFKATAIHCF